MPIIMRVYKHSLMLTLFTLAACPDSGKDGQTSDDTEAASTASGTDPGTTADPVTDTGAATTGIEGGSLCDAPPVFSDPGAAEYMQWVIDGTEYVSLPPPGGAYFFNSYLSVALYASDLSSSISFGSILAFPDGLAAGTYTCAGPDGVFVNGGGLGLANGQAPGSSCNIQLTEDVSDGGRVVGTLSARLVEVPSGKPSVCVDARFTLTDAAP